MDIFVEIVNLASAEAMWAHFVTVAVHPSQLWITGYPQAFDMNVREVVCSLGHFLKCAVSISLENQINWYYA